jgi:hypothetical protein
MFAKVVRLNDKGRDTATTNEIAIPSGLTHNQVVAWLAERNYIGMFWRLAGIYEVR